MKRYGESDVARVLNLFRQNAGWPVAKLVETGEIAGTKLSAAEFEIAKALANKGLVQPPAITTSYSGTNQFLFTPPLGTERILVVEKEVYEKAMACISCVRQGEHFARWKIISPRLIIEALLREGKLGATTMAKEQYRAMRVRGIIKLANVGGNWWRPVLVDNTENRRALSLALDMLRVESHLAREASTRVWQRQYTVTQNTLKRSGVTATLCEEESFRGPRMNTMP